MLVGLEPAQVESNVGIVLQLVTVAGGAVVLEDLGALADRGLVRRPAALPPHNGHRSTRAAQQPNG
jgi:hypothetical protein